MKDPGERWLLDRLEVLRGLAGEVRVNLHLGQLDAKDRWHALEAMVRDVEQLASGAGSVSREAVEHLVTSVREFRDALARHRGGEHS